MDGNGCGEWARGGPRQMSQWWLSADMYSDRHCAAAWYRLGSGAYVSSLPSSFSTMDLAVVG